MRKLQVGAAVAAMGFAAMASADELNISVLANGSTSVSVGNSEAVTIVISGLVDSDGAGGAATGSGLALFGTNIDADASSITGGSFDITDQAQFLVTAPAGMADFDRNLGLTNPPGPPSPVTGYSGTASGTDLLQIGGGQNTIGNVDPPAYPVGSVTIGVANNSDTDLATGTLTTPASPATGSIVLTLSACFSNTLDSAVGPPFAVSSAQCNVVGTATINFGVNPCADQDVNCDGSVSALDLAEVQAPLNWAMLAGAAANPRADVNGDGSVSALDLAEIQAPLNWATSTGPCSSPDCP